MSKWTNSLTGWKRRYFNLENDKLSYSKKRGGKVKASVDMTQAKIVPNSLYPARFKIQHGKKFIHVKAYSVLEARSWLTALLKKSPMAEPFEEDKQPESIRQTRSLPRMSFQPDRLMLVVSKLMINNDTLMSLAKTLQASGSQRETVKQLIDTVEASNHLLSQVSVDMMLEDAHASDCSGISDEFYDAVEDEVVDAVEVHRSQLPHQREPGLKVSIWKVIKDNIGKELSKISVPVYFNEPLSFLQRYAEELTYSHLLEQAAKLPDHAKRIAFVAAFATSPYSTSINRTMKPFNPMLGETFEVQKGKLRFISEQVSHHPPITAVHAEHPDYRFWGSMQPTTKFKGSYVQVRCIGMVHVEFPKLGEHYTWEKPNSSVHNIVVGNIYIDHHGSFTVRDLNSNARAEVHFDKRGWFAASSRDVRAEVFDASGEVKYTLTGNWSTHLDLHNLLDLHDQRIWETVPLPQDYEFSYFMTDFAMQLNHPPDCYPGLPQTDTRYRPDQRAVENGDIDTAIAEKDRIEEKQRQARKVREAAHEDWSPTWFSHLDGEWKYLGGYWEQRATGKFKRLPDIF